MVLLSQIYAIINTLNDYEEEEQGDQPPRNLVMWRARKLMKSLMMHGSRNARHPGRYTWNGLIIGQGGYQWNYYVPGVTVPDF